MSERVSEEYNLSACCSPCQFAAFASMFYIVQVSFKVSTQKQDEETNLLERVRTTRELVCLKKNNNKRTEATVG